MALLRQQTVQLGHRPCPTLLPRAPLEHVPHSLCCRGGRSGVQSFAALSWQQGSVAAFWLLPPSCASALNLAEGCELKAGEHEEGVAPQSGPPASSVALGDSSPGQQEDAVLLAWAEDGARTASRPLAGWRRWVR